MEDLKTYLEVAIEAAREGGRRTLPYFESGTQVEHKEDDSPVTEADRRAETAIREVIGRHFPEHEIYGEEFGTRQGSSPLRWIVDPLDATRNFIRRIPHYATLVGLEKDGEIVVGVVYEPVWDRLTYATRGAGAFDGDGRRLQVSNIARLSQARLVYSSLRLMARYNYARPFARLLEAVDYDSGYGDYYGHLLVARGSADVMVDPVVAPYDVAAVRLIVEEAGGRFSSLSGERTIYAGSALSTNGTLHPEVLEMFRAPEQDQGRSRLV